jgi:superoxide reductase
MKTFVCSVCGHIEFNAAPPRCLVCRADRDAFKEDAKAIATPANPAALTDGDKKHIPVLNVCKCDGSVKVSANIGEIEHVMQDAHFIQYLDFYLNDAFISRAWLSPNVTKPFAAVKLATTSGKVTVIEHCNVHGNWMSQVSI